MAVRNKHFDADGRPVLDAREHRFVEEYVCGGKRQRNNAYGSARAAGYSHDMAVTYSAMWVREGSAKDQKPWVYQAIQERRAQIAAEEGITPEWVKAEIAKLARGAVPHKITAAGDAYIDLSDLDRDELLTLQSIQVEEYLEGRGEDAREIKKTKVQQYSRLEALKELAKMFGITTTSKVVHSNDPDNPMPGPVQYDLSLLSKEEADTLITLMRKATPQPPQAKKPEDEIEQP